MSDDAPAPKKKILLKKKSPGGAKKKKKPLAKLKKKPAARPAPIEESTAADAARAADTLPVAAIPETEAEETVVSSFEFFCPYCAHANTTSHDQVGDDISCEGCGSTITVPPPLAAPSEAQSKKRTVKFFCSVCGQKLSATPEQVGANTVCPGCNSAIMVPHAQPAPPDGSETVSERSAETFKFHCPVCAKKFEAKKSWAGRPFVCPSCESEVTVPEPPR